MNDAIKMVIDSNNEKEMKLGSKVKLSKAGKTKVDSEISIKAVNSAKKNTSRKPCTWDRVMIDCLAHTGDWLT